MKIRTASLILTLLSCTGLTALATPLNSSVTSVVSVTPGSTVTNSDSWSGTPRDLFSGAGYGGQGGSIFSNALTFGTAADGNSGSAFLLAGWDLAQGATNAYTEGTQWNYTFMADATGNFVMDYCLLLSGANTFCLNGFVLSGDLGFHYFTAANTNGQFLASVIAGHSYSISLSTNANISGENLDPFQGTMSGSFTWTLPGSATVPDTAGTVGLMAMSFAGLVAIRRKIGRS